jgi:hypothetical protein
MTPHESGESLGLTGGRAYRETPARISDGEGERPGADDPGAAPRPWARARRVVVSAGTQEAVAARCAEKGGRVGGETGTRSSNTPCFM